MIHYIRKRGKGRGGGERGKSDYSLGNYLLELPVSNEKHKLYLDLFARQEPKGERSSVILCCTSERSFCRICVFVEKCKPQEQLNSDQTDEEQLLFLICQLYPVVFFLAWHPMVFFQGQIFRAGQWMLLWVPG